MEFSDACFMVSGFLITLGLMLAIMPPLITYLRRIKFGQSERKKV